MSKLLSSLSLEFVEESHGHSTTKYRKKNGNTKRRLKTILLGLKLGKRRKSICTELV